MLRQALAGNRVQHMVCIQDVAFEEAVDGHMEEAKAISLAYTELQVEAPGVTSGYVRICITLPLQLAVAQLATSAATCTGHRCTFCGIRFEIRSHR